MCVCVRYFNAKASGNKDEYQPSAFQVVTLNRVFEAWPAPALLYMISFIYTSCHGVMQCRRRQPDFSVKKWNSLWGL